MKSMQLTNSGMPETTTPYVCLYAWWCWKTRLNQSDARLFKALEAEDLQEAEKYTLTNQQWVDLKHLKDAMVEVAKMPWHEREALQLQYSAWLN